MEAMRESWTDERLDDFRAETARRLDGIDAKLEKIDERFERLEERLDLKFDRVNARFDDLYRALIFLGGGAIVTFVVGFAGLIFAG
jgi:chromosome segregation ATPase